MLMRHNMFGRCSAQAPRPHEACCVIHFEIVENGEEDSQFQVEDKKAKTSEKKEYSGTESWRQRLWGEGYNY